MKSLITSLLLLALFYLQVQSRNLRGCGGKVGDGSGGGGWTTTQAPSTCPKPPDVPFASEPTLSNGGTMATYTCLSGYRIIGGNGAASGIVTCSTQSQFWPKLSSCEPVVCGVPPAGTNTVPVVASSIVYPNSYTYVCNTNYESGTSLESKCLADGTWSLTPAPTCTQKTCKASALPTLANADGLRQDVPIGGTLEFTCRLNYRLAPATPTSTYRVQTVTCQVDGTFTALTKTCVYLRPESCRDYFARDNLFAAATTACVTVILDPQGPDLSDPTNPPQFTAECCKTSTTGYCTQVSPDVGATYSSPLVTACVGTGPTPALDTGPLGTLLDGVVSTLCDVSTAVTYPITNAQIVSMIGSTSGTCSQQTTITCAAAGNSRSLALRANGEASGRLYGTAAFPVRAPAAGAQISLTHYTYADAVCDCTGGCSQGCACTRIGFGNPAATDTITKNLTAATPTYVTNYQLTVHNTQGSAGLVANEMSINVGAIRCCETW